MNLLVVFLLDMMPYFTVLNNILLLNKTIDILLFHIIVCPDIRLKLDIQFIHIIFE